MDNKPYGASMAIAFAHVSIHTRTKGHSAVAASAYRSGTTLYDERTGLTHDYTNRHDVVFSSLLLPESSNLQFQNREFLWNQAEASETRKNAQVCKDVMLALPKELNLNQQIELATSFAKTHFIANGIPTDVAIHDHGDGNPHAHLLITTRRLEKDGFSTHKARDLNPAFAKKSIVEKDHWGELWRDFQNDFFKEHRFDLSVDLNHVVSEKHRGRIRDKITSYVHEEKQLIKEARREIALLRPQDFIARISQSHSVFSRRDIEKLVFKTFEMDGKTTDYLNVVAQILENKNVIKLGANDEGMEAFTTRKQYRQEAALLSHIEDLYSKKSHRVSKPLDNFIKQYGLNEEQAVALNFIAKGEDISVLVGRPGAGKSYLLKPLNLLYETHNYTVLGAALSGKVAKSLQAETSIASSTIASLTYRLKTGMLALDKNHILVIDEAGMVDFDNMACLIKHVRRAGAKIVLVGDPEQLKPIQKGEIFRGIASRIGYIELENIKRQRDLGDRKASLDLAKGKVDDAMHHYLRKGAISMTKNREEAVKYLINDWQHNLNVDTLKEHIMLAYSRLAVASLNEAGRKALQDKGIVKEGSFKYFSENGEKPILLAEGERVLLRQNNKEIGIRNGDLATIQSINGHSFTAILDSGEKVTVPKTYRNIEYGYAMTVHKSQGMTKDKSFVYIDSKQWDRHLAFVAMTRHRESLKIYCHKGLFPDFKKLMTTLSRSVIKDNVIDWPLDYAIRRGFDPKNLIGRATQYITKAAHTIKNKWVFLVNYESYLNTKNMKAKLKERQNMRDKAEKMALFMDETRVLAKEIKQAEKEAKDKGIKQTELPEFETLYKRCLLSDEKAVKISASSLKN